MSQLEYPDEWAFDEFIDIRVVAAQVTCLILTVIAIILPAIKLNSVKSPFFIFCLIVPVPCLVADISYFLTISKVITINQNEVPRVMSAFVSLWIICTLSSVRFRAFHKAGTVLWYDDRRSSVIISTLLLQGITTTSILAYTYASQVHLPHFPTHPWRKITIALQAATSIFVNFVIDAFSFMTVWQIRMGVLRRKQIMQQSMSTKAAVTESAASAAGAASNVESPNDPPSPARQSTHPRTMFWWWVPASALARIRNDLIESRHSGGSSVGGGGTSSGGLEMSSGQDLATGHSPSYYSANTRSALVSSPPVAPSLRVSGSAEKVNSFSARQLPNPTISVTSSALLSPSSDCPSPQSVTLLQPSNGSKSANPYGSQLSAARHRRRKSREQKRLARFKRTTGVVLCMLGFLLLSSIVGLIVYLNLAHLLGDTMSALAARIYIAACFVNWTILAQVVR